LVTEDIANGRRDVALGENPRRELIEQRLEQVMVGPIDDCDIDIGGTPQPLRGEEPSETGSYDHHMVAPNPCAFHLFLLGARLSVQAPEQAQA
jgi:hypothetical protein